MGKKIGYDLSLLLKLLKIGLVDSHENNLKCRRHMS